MITGLDFNVVAQGAADAEALQHLWLRLLPAPAPSYDELCHWLTGLSFFHIGRVIHKVQSLHHKYNKTLRPAQLLRFFKQECTLSLKQS
jgi:hypothetical protein